MLSMPLNVAMMICVKMVECIVRHVLTAWYVHHPAFFTVMVRTQKQYQIKTSLQWETNRILYMVCRTAVANIRKIEPVDDVHDGVHNVVQLPQPE